MVARKKALKRMALTKASRPMHAPSQYKFVVKILQLRCLIFIKGYKTR